MPPASKKNVSVILFDVNCEETFQEAANKCLMDIWSTKWFSGSKDCTKLILLNTAETNIENSKFSKAKHLSEVTSVISYMPKILQQHLEGVEVGNGDWVVGIALAIEALKTINESVKAVMTLQLLLISDFSHSPKEFKRNQIEFIKSSLENLNCFLYVLGPKVKVPMHMASFKDIQQWSKKVEFIDGETPSLAVVKEIVEATPYSVVCDLDLGQQLFSNYVNLWGLQAWLVPLTIGTELVIPSSMVRFLRSVHPPRIRAQNVQKVEWSWHLSNDVNAEVRYDNVVGGLFRHGKFVPLTRDIENNFKSQEARCFQIIGFTDQRNISEVFLCGDGSSYVQGNNSRNFELLLHILAKRKLCAIAKRIYLANCRPKLYAMFPNEKDDVFIATPLPFGDNANTKMVEQENLQEAPALTNNPLMTDVCDYLNKLDVTNPENVDEYGSVKIPLNGTITSPIRLSIINQQLQRKYLGDDIILQDYNSFRMLDDFEPYLHLCQARATEKIEI